MWGFLPIRAIQAGATAFAAIALLASSPASAGKATSQMAVRVVIPAGCQVTTRPLDFGDVAILTGSVDASSTMTLRCAPGTPYSVALDNGVHSNGAQRRMSSGSGGLLGYVNYNLYRNAGRNLAWTSSDTMSGIAPASGTVNLTVYGRMPGSIVLPTSYVDTITVTVSF